MPEEKDIRTMIDEDIDRVERVWEASSYDSDALEELFRLLLEHYAERIEGFTKRLKVIQPYEISRIWRRIIGRTCRHYWSG